MTMKKTTLLLCLLFAGFGAAAADFPVVYTYDTAKQQPFELSVPVPDGNYLVTLEIGSRKRAARTFVKAESRRLCVNDLATAKGEIKTVQFLVNKRDRSIREGGETVATVITKPREKFKLNWDDNLTLEIGGDAPAVASVRIEPAPAGVTTIFLCGDSTVVDQDIEPWASWGQMFPWFFDTHVAVANYAESGERADTFIGAGRLRKILSVMQPGDWVFVEFGHNDMKLKGPGKGGYYFFATQLKTFIDEIRAKGGRPVLVSPTHRRNFDADGHIIETHEDYPEAMEWVARREGVPFLDLHRMSGIFYEAMGPEASKGAFVHYKAGSFEGMPNDVEDNTHFNTYGAFELAKCVVSAIQAAGLPLAEHVTNFEGFSPACPDAPESFRWPLSPFRDTYGVQVSEKDDAATAVK
ncbi:MAG: rhamnogalacturonan acetylesterase [Bacteroidales bacterium]|nr:rhamnogalacturonan acetylesterase [Bacteroidales bacterium]